MLEVEAEGLAQLFEAPKVPRYARAYSFARSRRLRLHLEAAHVESHHFVSLLLFSLKCKEISPRIAERPEGGYASLLDHGAGTAQENQNIVVRWGHHL